MSDDNRYSAPEADLYEQPEAGEYGSVEKALEGNYELGVRTTLSEAWATTKGNKMTLWGGFLLYFFVAAVYLAGSFLITYMANPDLENATSAGSLFTLPLDLIYYGISAVMGVGFYVMGAKLSMGLPAGSGEMFRYMNQFVKGLLTYLLMMVMILLGFLLLVLPGIYLAFAYLFAIPLAVEKNMSIWQAMETSRKGVSKRWFTVAGLVIITSFINLAAFLTLGIALIWTMPMTILVYGIIYRNIFGLEQETIAA